MNRARNLIVFNHMSKTAGTSIVKALRQSNQDNFVDLLKINSRGINDQKTTKTTIQKIILTQDTFLYTSFHPVDIKLRKNIQKFVQDWSICFSVLRRPSEVFESIVRYFYDRSTQNPKYFKCMLDSQQILQIRDPNTIFDLCLEFEKNNTKTEKLYLIQYLRALNNNLPASLSVCSKKACDLLYNNNQKYIDYSIFFDTIQKDYFALCTIEQLDILLQFLKQKSIISKSAKLPKINTSLTGDSIFLTEDRRNKIDREFCAINHTIWNYVLQHGPLFNDCLLEEQRQLLKSNTVYF